MMRLGCQRKLEAAYALSMGFLENEVDEDPEAYEAASTCAYALDEAGRISVEWLLAALERPEEPVFAVVADVVRRHRSSAVFEALERVLESPVRGGASAATAAASLVAMDVPLPDDPRIPGIVERAPLEPRAGLVGMVVCVGGSFGSLRGHVVDLLSCADTDAARTVFEDLYGKQPEGTLEVCEEALARGANPAIRGGSSASLISRTRRRCTGAILGMRKTRSRPRRTRTRTRRTRTGLAEGGGGIVPLTEPRERRSSHSSERAMIRGFGAPVRHRDSRSCARPG